MMKSEVVKGTEIETNVYISLDVQIEINLTYFDIGTTLIIMAFQYKFSGHSSPMN